MILTKDKSITDLIKYYMGMISICLMALAFPGDANAKVDQGICDLKVLSLLIAKQTNAVFSTGSPEVIKALKHSQQELKQALALLYKKIPITVAPVKYLKMDECSVPILICLYSIKTA